MSSIARRSFALVLLAAYIGAFSVFGDAKPSSATEPNIKTQSHCPRGAKCALINKDEKHHIHLGTYNNEGENEPLVIKVHKSQLKEPRYYAVTADSRKATGNEWMSVGVFNTGEHKKVKGRHQKYFNRILTKKFMRRIVMTGQQAHGIRAIAFVTRNVKKTVYDIKFRGGHHVEARPESTTEAVHVQDGDEVDAQPKTTTDSVSVAEGDEAEAQTEASPDADAAAEGDEAEAQTEASPDADASAEGDEGDAQSKTSPDADAIAEGNVPCEITSVKGPEVSKGSIIINPDVKEGKYYVVFAYGNPFGGPKMVCFKEVVVKVLP
ncbi:chromosome segregation and condensation protein [Babesia ovata]|uniref:Chromosome segregation and condensation protein n=1 Tax=Babesia ovata TaxID=189622 RepID=A0A2H6KAP9_9APIC|nr:chromosome segregation and condensation protein [Babesia ovata]GBE60074.1 chromosome segregation and condensation protein [Babesia ovata]